MPVDCYLNSLESPFPIEEVSGWFLSLSYLTEIPVVNANSVDPDQIWIYTVFQCPFYGLIGING